MCSKTLVLTPWYFPYKIVGWQDATTLVYLQKVDVIVEYDEVIRSPSTAIRLPAVVRMTRAVPRVKRRVKLSRINVYLQALRELRSAVEASPPFLPRHGRRAPT